MLLARRWLLWRRYGFHRWHVRHGPGYDGYAREALKILNDRPVRGRERLLDIGCGLGNVLLRARYTVRIGIEREERVRAALVHAIRSTRYLSVCGSLDDVPETFRFDAICALNGVFDVLDAQEARALMTRLVRKLTDSGILLFTVARGVVEDYPHRHDAAVLAPGATCVYSRPPHLLYATGPGFDGIGEHGGATEGLQ